MGCFCCNLHRLISAAIGRWVTSDPAELPILPAHLCVPYVWVLRDTKRFFENFVNQKWRMWRIASKKTIGGRDFCLEIVSVGAFVGKQPALTSQAETRLEVNPKAETLKLYLNG